MPLTSKRTDLTRILFRPILLQQDFLEKVGETLETLRFKGFYRQTDKEASGFAPLLKQEIEGFASKEDWLDGGMLFMAFRTDTKRLPTGLLKARVKLAVAKWCEDRGVEKCPAAIKKEIKQTLEEDLLTRALPTTKVSEVLIFPARGEIWIDSTSDKRVDEVRKAIRKLGFEGRVWTPGEHRREDTEDVMQSSDLGAGVVTSFYAWLWHRSETGQGLFNNGAHGQPLHVWIDSRIAFRRLVEEKASTVVTGDNPADAVTARAAIANGMVIQDVRIGLKREDRDYFVTLYGSNMQIKAAQMPSIQGEESEGQTAGHANLYDRIFLLSEMNEILFTLFEIYLHGHLENLDSLNSQICDWARQDGPSTDVIDAEFEDA